MRLEVQRALPAQPAGRPPVLLVHGSNLAAWCWQEHLLPFLAAAGYPAHALSLRGHGGSEGGDQLQTFTLDDYLADVLEVAAGLDAPVLVGHSMGGAIGQRVLREHPEAISGLALLASVPPTGLGSDTTRLAVRHSAELVRMREFNAGRAGDFPVELYLSDRAPAGDRQALAGRLQRESERAGYALTGRVVRPRPEPARPVFVAGGLADRIVAADSVRGTARAYRTRPVLVSGVGHLVMLDPGWRQVAEPLLAFLAGLPARLAAGEAR